MSESGGGHGSWIVTYSDMITLLMACFIMIITFASKETERFSKKRDALVGGSGGTGVAGAQDRGLDRDTIVWRQRPLTARVGEGGSEMPPLFSDPALQTTSQVLRALDLPTLGKLRDSYSLRLPLALLLDDRGRPTPTATDVLHAIAQHVQHLPYDIQLQVDRDRHLGQAVSLAQHLMLKEAFYPGRLGVAVRPGAEPWKDSVWLVFVRHP